MENELTPQKLLENLKEKIKVEFVKIVPEENWDKLIKESIDSFITKDFLTVLKAEIQIIVKKKVKEYLLKTFGDYYDQQTHDRRLNEELASLIRQQAPAIIESIFTDILARNMPNIRNAIISHY